MKLSSSTLCGCCFCCYCHCWLMMLLMVSSVVHVSPEMPTPTKKYTKLNNNHYYQSEMTEFVKLNRKIPNRTLEKPTTPPTKSPLLTTENDFNGNKMNIYPILENNMMTTIATIQKLSTITSTETGGRTTTQVRASLPATPAAVTTSLLPEQQEQQHQHDATTTLRRNVESKRQHKVEESVFYLGDNSNGAMTTIAGTTTTPDNYVADNNVFKQDQTIAKTISTKPLEIAMKQQIDDVETNTIQITKQDDYSSNMNNRSLQNWNTSIELTSNIRKQQQQHNTNNRSESIQKTTRLNNNRNSSSNVNRTINNTSSNHLINMNTQKSYQLQATTSREITTKPPAVSTLLTSSTGNSNNKKQPTAITSLNTETSTSDSSRSSINSSDNTWNITNSQYNRSSNSNNMNNKYHKTSASNRYSSTRYLQIPAAATSSSSLSDFSTTDSLKLRTTTTPTSEISSTTYSSALEQYNQLKRPAFLHRSTRQITDDEQNEKCRMFIEGDPEKNELYSPDYPNVYPKNINCTRVITAPKGQIIRLDFRNSFHIEEMGDCKFDFLEIRDGQYGFSNLKGKYCGTDFPPEITSKERYLWLHFHSDESIEYSGFTAVYEFIDRNRDAPSTDLNCTIERDGFHGFVNATDVPAEIRKTVLTNKIPLDCMWRIQVEDKWKIQVKFLDFNLAKPNDCERNFLDIFPEQTVMPLRVKNFCGSAGESITSDSNILHMRFYAEQLAINSTFAILYTAFRDKGITCTEDEFDCEDNTCIHKDLKCNDFDNCKFRLDEEDCDPKKDESKSEHMTIIITVFGLILGGMVATFLVNCVRKIMHDQKIIREHIRQSKESKLDEMGRNSKARSRDNISIVSPRQKHSQTSLQILDDVSNRYYREMELQTKGNFKEKDHSILRHDMIVQTSLCSTDDSSTTITEQQTPSDGNACDMGCQTRESLFATASLMRQKSKTPSMAGSQRTIEGVPPPPRFSTFGYDAAQIAPPPPPTVSTLSRRNMHLPQESLEMEQLPQQTAHMMMPHQQQQHQQQHQHLHHRPSQEICHHHHQHQQHLQQQMQQQQKQTLPRHQQQHHHQHLQQQHQQQQHQQHHTSATTIPPNVTHLQSAPGTTVVTAISTGSSGRQRDGGGGGGAVQGGKNKQTKVDESKVFIDIRNSAPDVIIMTSH